MEEWKQIEGTNYYVSYEGEVINHTTGKTIKPFVGGTVHYLMVNIWGSGKNRLVAVHRLVAEAFIPNPEGKRTVNHKNGIRHDNWVGNLEWNTYSENLQHSVDTGLNHRGSKKVNAKLTEESVRDIRQQIAGGARNSEIAKIYRVHEATINQIRNGNTWKHVA